MTVALWAGNLVVRMVDCSVAQTVAMMVAAMAASTVVKSADLSAV